MRSWDVLVRVGSGWVWGVGSEVGEPAGGQAEQPIHRYQDDSEGQHVVILVGIGRRLTGRPAAVVATTHKLDGPSGELKAGPVYAIIALPDPWILGAIESFAFQFAFDENPAAF